MNELIEQISQTIRDQYVVTEHIDETIGELLEAAPSYREIRDPFDLATTLTKILRQASADMHFAVIYQPAGAPATGAIPFDFAALAPRHNNFFYNASRLAGNVGYLELRLFPDPARAARTVIGAMAFLAGTDALIFDLRQNRGGRPEMVQLLLSYLLPGPTHINSFQNRGDATLRQFWTLPYVPGEIRPDTPVYVLTSSQTGSAAEEFAYDLQQLGRATLVGETTIGMAHPVQTFPLRDGFSINVPIGRPINPISGTDWEGAGVVPDVAVPADKALVTAHELALAGLLESCRDLELADFYRWELETVRADQGRWADLNLDLFVGNYEGREVRLEGGRLHFYSPHFSGALKAVGPDTFALSDEIRLTFNAAGLALNWRDLPRQQQLARTGP